MNVTKFVYILVYLFSYHQHQHPDNHILPCNTRSVNLYQHLGPKMADVPPAAHQQQDEDPQTMLSGVALVERLMEYCNNQIISNAKLEREYITELTNDKIALVIKGFGDGLATLSKDIASTTARTNDLADLELKLDTTLAYQEQQLFNLKKGIQDVLLKIETDMKALRTGYQSDKNFDSSLVHHIQCLHGISLLACSICANCINRPGNLPSPPPNDHIDLPRQQQPVASFLTSQPPILSQQSRHEQLILCDLCGELFTEMDSLDNHLKHHHATHTFACKYCDGTFSSQSSLEHHLALKHRDLTLSSNNTTRSPLSHTCSHCGKRFQTQEMLKSHTNKDHAASNSPCEDCDNTFQSSSSTKDPIADNDYPTHINSIAQYDGIDDSVVDGALSLPSSSSNVDVLTRVANFELNEKRQTSGIYRDAHLEDFKIISKDHNKSISIECNSGFYAQVAKPTLCSLSQDNIPPVLGITIFCENVTTNLDKKGYEFNRTMFFKLDGVKKVTVHVHHSTRLVQVQGGSIMSDKTSAASWFVKNVLHGKFQLLARAKSYDISKFNQELSSFQSSMGLSTGDSSKILCGFCDKTFDSRSVPTYCFQCTKSFHKTNCFKSHKCSRLPVRSVLTVSSVPAPHTRSVTPCRTSVSNVTTTQQPDTSQTVPTRSLPSFHPAITTTVSSSSNMSSPRSSSPSATNSGPNIVPSTEIARLTTEAEQNPVMPGRVSSLDPNASFFLPQSLSNYQQPSINTRPTKQKSKDQDFSSEKARIESLKIELSYARTKIVDLENKVKDGQESLKIYSHKVRILEENRAAFLNGKYFTNASQPDNTSSSGAFSSSTSISSSDCSCQIRANLNRNSLKLNEFELRFSELCQVVDGLARSGAPGDIPEKVACQSPCPPEPVVPHAVPPDLNHSQQTKPGPVTHPVELDQTSDIPEIALPNNDFLNDALDISSDVESSDFVFSDPEDINLQKLPLN